MCHYWHHSRAGLCMEFKPPPSLMQNELVTEPWVQTEGSISVRQTPGLGVGALQAAVENTRFRVPQVK